MNFKSKIAVYTSLVLSGITLSFGQPVEGEYIVEVKNGINPAGVAQKHGIQARHVYSRALNGFAGAIPPGQLKKLQQDPAVSRIVEDNLVFAIGKPSGSGGTTTPQIVPEGVKRVGANPGATSYTGQGVGVAVVDTGVDLANADLTVSTYAFSAFSDDANDLHGHGTHVAGTIAARNNSIDVVGVAPQATIYAVKVLNNSGSGTDSGIIAGMDWILASLTDANVSPRIRVANMSLGRDASPDDSLLRAAIKRVYDAGVTVAVAAGNDPYLEAKDQVPAGFPEVIAVASSTARDGTSASSRVSPIKADTASYFTSDGKLDPATKIGVSISAPGEDRENITKSLFINSEGILSLKRGGGTARMSGTSMASPHVAGISAGLWHQALQLNPSSPAGVTPENIRTRLRNGASRVGIAPLNSPTSAYTFDSEREGVANLPGALTAVY